MAALFRFLAGLVAHTAWQRAGRRGPLPPVRLPGRRTTNLPIPSPWQMMVASWVAERAWKAYGPEVKGRLAQNPSPVAHKINDLLPGPTATVVTTPASTPATQNTPVPHIAAPQVAPPTPQAVTTTPAPARKYATQRLPQQDDDQLPPGSVLQSLRPSS